ncbi:hypothetical protein MBLNU457_3255t1 [Dothideomycetes sp. NU457]
MPKEKNYNPMQAQKKADKKAAQKKQQKAHQIQRNERLVKRNPHRIERQIADLKALQQQGGLKPRDEQTLAGLEKELKGVLRAREEAGDAAPKFRAYHNDNDELREGRREGPERGTKRRRDDDESDTDPEVRGIPMPRDTPPPIPRQKRREEEKKLPPPQTTYSSAPVMRDLKQEVRRFVPAAVAQNLARSKGKGGLVEPEEMDRLERAGYGDRKSEGLREDVKEDVEHVTEEMEKEAEFRAMMEVAEMEKSEGGLPRAVQANVADRAVRRVEMEEVVDEEF